MPKFNIIVHTETRAPPKPVVGAPCNGCGVCCLMEPCPLGVFLTGKRAGTCAALRWQEAIRMYRCGALSEPGEVLRARLPTWAHGLVPLGSRLLHRLAGRWIAAGAGCDCDAQVVTGGKSRESKPDLKPL
jgi:hypothetical protein